MRSRDGNSTCVELGRKGDIMSDIAKRLARLPMVKWEAAIDKLPSMTLQSLVRELDSITFHYARLAAYASMRELGQGHKAAVKEQNRVARRVRKVFTYHTTHDINF